MARYHFVTRLRICADRQRVWQAILDPAAWPSWWRWLRSAELLEDGDADLVGARYRLSFGTAPPYTLSFESTTVRVIAPALLEAQVSGDLAGSGLRQLDDAAHASTDVTYTWLVETTKRWMNAVAPVARPLFSRNHDVLMRDFGRGLAQDVDARLLLVENTTVPPSHPGFFILPRPDPHDDRP